MMNYESLFIGGEWVTPDSQKTITVLSASTEDVLGTVPEANERDVDRAVESARAAFDAPTGWSTWPGSKRAETMRRLASALESRSEETVHRVSS